MKRYILDAEAGEDIREYAKRLLLTWQFQTNKAKEFDLFSEEIIIEGKFNNVNIFVGKDTTEKNIVTYYHDKLEENQKIYEESDEYKERKIKDELELKTMQLNINKLIEKFELLDFNNTNDIVQWLYKIQPYTDRVGIKFPKHQIVNTLIKHGYKTGENTGDEFKEADKENFARYLIGQCIDGLNLVGAIHPMVIHFTEDWATKFEVKLK